MEIICDRCMMLNIVRHWSRLLSTHCQYFSSSKRQGGQGTVFILLYLFLSLSQVTMLKVHWNHRLQPWCA